MNSMKNAASNAIRNRINLWVLRVWARHMSRLMACMMAALTAVLSPLAQAADKPQAAPTVVDVGVFLNNIRAINLKERKFQADFNLWKANFGNHAGGGSGGNGSTAVPEPATLWLLLVGMLTICFRQRTKA